MTTGYPFTAIAEAPLRAPPFPARKSPETNTSAVRYPIGRNSRAVIASAIVISASLHAGLLLGIRPQPAAAAAPQQEEERVIRLAMPELKDLEEPEPMPIDSEAPPPDLGIVVPMQADVPQLVRPTDFVQALNFDSLLEKPDFSQLNVYAVPEHIRAGGTNLAEQFGRIFNLSDLDRVPEPVLQPAPTFPAIMRRESQTGTVVVEFIVDVHGRVLQPLVVDSTHLGFEEAALSGVSRWRFRAGQKAGRRVNTRMRVPILFKIQDPLD